MINFKQGIYKSPLSKTKFLMKKKSGKKVADDASSRGVFSKRKQVVWILFTPLVWRSLAVKEFNFFSNQP